MVKFQPEVLTGIAGKITGIHVEPVHLGESFLDFAARFAGIPGTVLLMSGGELDCARYHILGARPWLTFSGRNHNMKLAVENQTLQFDADPFDTLRMILNTFRLDDPIWPAPVSAGLLGYLAYDLKDCLEDLPRTSVDDLQLPHICLFAPSILLVHDTSHRSTHLYVPKRTRSDRNLWPADMAAFKELLTSPPPDPGSFRGNTAEFRSNLSRTNYMDAIRKIREYIASGDVYQVNMSQRFQTDFAGVPFSLFRTLYNQNPAPFFAYVNAGDHQVVSTSPERFVRRSGAQIETRPIKGTRPRGKTPAEDAKLRLQLENSKKDDAELSMIVDLLRNDIGKVCQAASVRVKEHKRVEAYQNVYHLVSIVEGQLDPDRDSVDLIQAAFPGGSITGCPKIRSMEIIDELEPHRRHIYTGSIGYISFHDTMDLSIAIRTATICNQKIIFSVGGGIVFDSNPSDEYDETLHKGHTLMQVFKDHPAAPTAFPHVWINGTIQPRGQACVPITDQGFQYGYGFFETIRVVKGEPKRLDRHLGRFYETWKHLFVDPVPDLTWNDIIGQVITCNHLGDQVAAVKIIATRGDREKAPFNHTLLVMARPYTHRLELKKSPGLNLSVYPHPRQTPLADHKSLNYLYYLLAGQWAHAQGADEALILNPDGSVSETNSANILLRQGQTIVAPDSPHVLPGIMEKAVCEVCTTWGYKKTNRKVRLEDFFFADEVMITNSLMGAVPVLSINGKKLAPPTGLWREINEVVL